MFAQAAPEQERSSLEHRLKEIEAEILESERNLTMTQAERERYQHEVNTIKRRIDQLNAQIRQSQATVQVLTGQIKNTETSIDITLLKIDDLRGKLTGTLRAIYEEDRKSTVEILVSEKNISGFFDNSMNLEMLSLESRNLLGEIVTLKINLEEEKDFLDGKKSETEQLARIQALQAEESRRIQAAQEALLRQAQARETEQKQELDELRKQAAEIRARIFELAGTPTSEAPNFGEAYEIALWVEGITGIRPAFLLAILQQESAIGKNVGQCYLADTTSGTSVHITTGRRYSNGMHPTRDVPRFLIIVAELGRDPLKTPISCPMSFGYGGAMGPAQFIPSTWMMYRDRLHSILGRPANPWIIRDSFLASGVLLTDSGARSQTKQGEWRAAMIYFSGGTTNSNYFFYADQVLARADAFQRDINILNQSK